MINSLNIVLSRKILNGHRNHRIKPVGSRVHNKFMVVETQRILKRIVIWSPLHRNMQEFLNEPGKKLRSFLKIMSVDVALGLPFNIASYGLLLILLCKETGLRPGRLIGFLADTHIYLNHVQGLLDQLNRATYPLPRIIFEKFTSIFDWSYKDAKLLAYEHHPAIPFDIAI